jgi:cation diffusion facilitator family transporter
MAGHEHSTSHIVQSLAVNLAIAVAKGIAAAFTGSGAMLAETLHSFADCGNQILLLVGVTRAARPPDASHPLGYGRVVYFWSFMVAMLLFSGGGMFSIYEGVHKLEEGAHHVESIWLGVGILLFSLLLEGGSTVGNVVEINKRRGPMGFVTYLRETKDSDLVVVFGENSAAVVGLTFALLALGLAAYFDDSRWDAAGSLAIGLVLVGVALFLAIEIQSLLVGEAADPAIELAIREIAHDHPHLETVLQVITLQQGPGEVLVAVKLGFLPSLTAPQVADTINDFEEKLRGRHPEARWVFVEPDLEPEPGTAGRTSLSGG